MLHFERFLIGGRWVAPHGSGSFDVHDASTEELKARCAEELARYKVPEEFRFVTTLPRTPMGKVRKPELRALLQNGPEG